GWVAGRTAALAVDGRRWVETVVPTVSKEKLVVAGELVIHTARDTGPMPPAGLLAIKVRKAVRGRSEVGLGVELHGIQGDTVLPGSRDDVSGENIANERDSSRPCSNRLVNGEGISRSVAGLREVALALEHGGHNGASDAGAANLGPLEIEEVMGLVFPVVKLREPSRATDSEPVGILLVLVLWAAVEVVEETGGVEVVVAEVPVDAAMYSIGARLGGDVDEGGAAVAVFCVVSV